VFPRDFRHQMSVVSQRIRSLAINREIYQRSFDQLIPFLFPELSQAFVYLADLNRHAAGDVF